MSEQRPDASRGHREHPERTHAEREQRPDRPQPESGDRRTRWDKILNPLIVLAILAGLIAAMLVIYVLAS